MRFVPLLLVLPVLAGCATAPVSETPALPESPPTLAAVDARARGRVGQIVTLDGETYVGVRFTEVGPDSVRGTHRANEPLAVATAEVRHLVLLTKQASDIGPVVCGSLVALPFIAGAVEQAFTPSDNSPTCPFSEDLNAGELLGVAACSGVGAFFVAQQAFPPVPRRDDTFIPIAPLYQFADAPRAGVGLWRPTK